YSDITVETHGTNLGRIDNVAVSADLTDVTLPATDALSGDVSNLTARGAQITVFLPIDSLANAFALPGVHVAGTSQGLTVTTSVAVAGRTYPVTSVVDVSVRDGALRLAAHPDTAANPETPAPLSEQAAAQLGTTIPLGVFSAAAPSVTVDGNAVRIQGS